LILLTSKKKEFVSISEISQIHDYLNNYYIHNVFAYQNDSEKYQDIQSRFSNLVDSLYQIIQDMKRYNNKNNNNNWY
jgi:uncharacterized UPF0160 family protein